MRYLAKYSVKSRGDRNRLLTKVGLIHNITSEHCTTNNSRTAKDRFKPWAMDHLPKVDNAKRYPVRCLCDISEPFEPFVLGYPEHRGWLNDPHKDIDRLDGTPTTPEEKVAFIQEWLFFGVLLDVLKISGLKVNLQNFVRREGPRENGGFQSFLTTAELSNYLDQWYQRERDTDVLRRRECQGHVLNLLRPIIHLIHRIDYTQYPVSMDTDILLSILILGETLRNAAVYIWRLPPDDYPLRELKFIRRHNPLTERLVQSGRCLTEAAMLHRRLDNTGLYIATSIQWPHVSRIRPHNICTETQCMAFQVDETVYETAHAVDCPNPNDCSFVAVNVDKITLIIRQGDVPLVRIMGKEKRTELKIYPSSSGAAYIAFSHVWAHGLGNVKSNALPQCQLVRLNNFASTLFRIMGRKDDPLIWIDTLCIPVDSSLKEYRKSAISRLAETFGNSTKVLILDAELQQASFRCSRVELATRILCSGWMRRLWTLQEALVTQDGSPSLQKVWVQLLERPIALNYLVEQGIYNLRHTEAALISFFTSFPQYRSSIGNFATLSRALEYRSTSNPPDEAICLTSILSLNIRKVVEAGNSLEERMCAFYEQITQFPTEIVFHKGECLQREGYRWAPRSFLSLGPSSSGIFRADFNNISTRDEMGLHGRYPGFLVSVDKGRTESMGNHFHFIDPGEPSTFWQLCPEPASFTRTTNLEIISQQFRQEQSRVAKFDQAVSEAKTLGLVLSPKGTRVVECVLLKLKNLGNHQNPDEMEEIWGIYMCRASIYKGKADGKTLEELEKKEGLRLKATKLEGTQRWCIA